ncbi:MAG: glycosyltransferase [Alphaproteobacteria bacterium]|nr:glycosyltransferase [Alphaproteobacteria bacterium]
MVPLSVIIPALNAAGTLGATLEALAGCDVVGEIIVVDGGSSDASRDIAGARGARVITAPRGRGRQLAAGAEEAKGEWFLFLHADTRLGPGWAAEAAAFIARADNAHRAAAFRFALDDRAAAARWLEVMVAWRCRLLALPYGDQGLLIGRGLYRSLGGYRPLAMMEDVDLVRRIGRDRLNLLATPALTSAARYRAGYARRVLRNAVCLTLYWAGAPMSWITRLYGR